MVEPTSFFLDFVVAAAVGGLIGVEREHRADNATVIAGVRTFPLVSVGGFLAAFLARESASSFVLAAGILGAFGLSFMFVRVRETMGLTGMTTPVVMIVAFLLGSLIGYGYRLEGTVVGVVATLLLVTKQRLHRFAQYLDEAEILSALQFMVVLFILIPITATLDAPVLGQGWLGRGALVDPFVVLLVVVFVSTISFVSLLVMRQVGARRGLEFSGLLGGLVNSEATTASLAQRAADEPRLLGTAVTAAVLATTTMLVRNLAIAGVADPTFTLLVAMTPYVLPVAAVGVLVAFWTRRGADSAVEALRVKNPFAVLPALQFALVFAGVSLLANLAQDALGEVGVYVTALGGFVSAGAVIAGLASLVASGSVSVGVALSTSMLAIAASVGGKLVILRAVNADAFRRGAAPFAVMTLASVVGAIAAVTLS